MSCTGKQERAVCNLESIAVHLKRSSEIVLRDKRAHGLEENSGGGDRVRC